MLDYLYSAVFNCVFWIVVPVPIPVVAFVALTGYVLFSLAPGMFFNCLNLFWWHKIMRKLYYKLTGREDLKVLNTAKDS